MSASIIRGKRLTKVYSGEQSQYCELEPVDGEYDYAGYSTVEEMVQFAVAHGIKAYQWPIFSGERRSDISLEDVKRTCKELASDLAAIDPAIIEQNPLLSRVAQWLSESQVFVVLD